MPRPAGRTIARPISRALVTLIALVVAIGPVSAAPGGPGAGADTRVRPGGAAPIEDGLLERLESGATSRFVVEFTARASLSQARRITNWDARGQAVVDALRGTARSQAEAIDLVESTGGARAESFWLRNELIVTGPAELARSLARLRGVSQVRAERVFPLVKPVETKAVVLQEGSEPEWGVAKIGADAVWEQGITGSGIVIANIDTGVDYTHPALVNQYRGNLGDGSFDHDYNWWDPTGICGDEPCDNAEHGTHTMGTMVGGDGPGPFTPDIGVAPGARWIAAKGCEDFFCTEGSLLSSGQFILAPTDLTGANPDPSRRPDIVNNSWGGGPGETWYEDVVSAWRAAGIVPVFSAGNAGPGCNSGGSPGDYLASFSAGATDDTDTIADFSSRGPSPFGKINPDVSAPGVDVTSSVPGEGYSSFSGTSMAAPHVAGSIALVMSAELSLVGQIDPATAALRDTAVDILDDQCGGEEDGDPNNVYGDGRIDALAAVNLVATGGTLAGTVTDDDTAATIAGATVSAHNGDRTFNATTDADGNYELFLAAGSYTVTAEAFGYEAATAENVVIETDTTTTNDFALTALPRFDVSGFVTAIADGSPIENASVRAIGTPVAPALTDATGAYTLELPLGSYTLRASAGGCTEFAFADVDLIADMTVDFEVARKLDAFGHGCAPIAFSWDDAQTQSALFGDEFAGRLRLPFDFPFYGETYSQVFISDNGYLNFLGPDQFNPFPVELPDQAAPNAAVYALWQELRVGPGGAIEYASLGTEPNRAFLIEYDDVSGGGEHSFAVKLWENGDIDLVYDDAGTGDNAGIGIENADGTDALQIGFLTDVLSDDSAWRISEVPTGLVTGTVTDANDALPIDGAEVTATGSGRTVRTVDDGTYALRLLPGTYTLVISAPGYTTFQQEFTLAVDEELVIDAVLGAPLGSVDPTEITTEVELGTTTTVPVTISNTGSGPLEWTARERPTGFVPPELPSIDGNLTRPPTWGRADLPKGLPLAETSTIGDDLLNVIIDDPADDSAGGVEVTTVRAGADQAEITMVIDLASGASEAVGFVMLDVDQDATTGVPPDAFSGLPTQEVGVEYFVDLFAVHNPDPVAFIVDAFTFELVAVVPARVDDTSVGFDVPLEAIGGDDGFVNTAMTIGDFFQPLDWAPDVGFGLIEPFSDAPWVSTSPESGIVPAGESTEVDVTLGGEDVEAGEYAGQLVFTSNDPKSPPMIVQLALTVGLPASFGGLSGTVLDAHTGEPLRATVTVEAERDGNPYPVVVTTAGDGSYSAFAPEGTWPVTATKDGFVPVTVDAAVTAGVDTPGLDFALHELQPHATVDGGPLEIVLLPDKTDDATIVIGNPEGHEDLEWETGEVNLDGGAGLAAVSSGHTLRAGANPNARTTRDLGLRASPDARRINVPGDVLYAFGPEGVDNPWGVGFTGNLWLTDAFEGGDLCGFVSGCTTHEFTTDGTPTGTVLDGAWAEFFIGDMAFDPNNGWLWQVHIGGDNALVAIDPADGSIQAELTGSPWSGISQRGVAYDASSDTFYVGGWNEGIVYHVAGLSWPEPGETLDSCATADPAISGLAWNPAFNLLWVSTNSEGDTIYLVDPSTCESLQAIGHPEPGFNGAGLEIDAVGNLWTVAQSGTAYLIESGLPNFSDVPWLEVSPTEGTVVPDGEQTLTVSIDSTGLDPGVYRGQVVVLTNDPDNSSISLPVKLVVPAYRVGINAGGGRRTTADGIFYSSDRGFGRGPYGWSGTVNEVFRTDSPISGTDEDLLYKSLRQGMVAYRFNVPEGTYLVDLQFAEIMARPTGTRVFTVFIEDQPVLVNLDVWKEVGKNAAYDRSFVVEVTDGRLDIVFSGQQGDKPMISAILVTHRPDFAGE